MRYLLTLSYDGTRYHGWQVQPGALTVEGEVERCLATLLRRPVDIVAAGRTDAGVNAAHMVAHFDADDIAPDDTAYRLRRMLPPDIVCHSITTVAPDFHARFSAVARTYHYYIITEPDPFRRHYAWLPHYRLDFDAMNRAASALLEYDDFASFCKAHTDVKTTLCHITEAHWTETEPHCWRFRITANRFLRNMVRAIVGTLVEVGRGRMTEADFRAAIEGRSRALAGDSVPPQALFLQHIEY